MKCTQCLKETSNPKFCSKSCAATYNNIGIRRHGKAVNNCRQCNKPNKTSRRIFCSRSCTSRAQEKGLKHRLRMNALRQSRYRAKGYKVLAEGANPDKIKEIYLNCPSGFEVDHVVPLSKGGLHHEDNLQYLTVAANRSKGNRVV